MRKVFLSLAAIVALASASFAQAGKVTLGGGVRLGLPLGDFGESHSFGIGAELQGEARVADNISIPFSAGYTSFIGKTVDIGGGYGSYKVPSIGLIPILAGVRVYPSPQFFVGGKLGYGILTGGGESTGAFNYEPQIGFNGDKVQVALGYNGLSKSGETLSHLALTGIVKFN